MSENHIEIFSSSTSLGVEEQANDWAKRHNAEIVSASLAVHGSCSCSYHLAVVYKVKP